MKLIKIYTGPRCPSCMMLKEKLKNHRNADLIDWKDISLEDNYMDGIQDNVFQLPCAIFDEKQYTNIKDILKLMDDLQ